MDEERGEAAQRSAAVSAEQMRARFAKAEGLGFESCSSAPEIPQVSASAMGNCASWLYADTSYQAIEWLSFVHEAEGAFAVLDRLSA